MNKLKKDEKNILKAAVSAVISAVLVLTVIHPYVNKQTIENEETTLVTSDGDEIRKPVFMFFVSDADLKDKSIRLTIDRLLAEYGARVIFEEKNVDTDKKLLEDFPPVKDNTPALIMQDSDGNISDILFKTSDYAELKKAIEKAFTE